MAYFQQETKQERQEGSWALGCRGRSLDLRYQSGKHSPDDGQNHVSGEDPKGANRWEKSRRSKLCRDQGEGELCRGAGKPGGKPRQCDILRPQEREHLKAEHRVYQMLLREKEPRNSEMDTRFAT